MARNQRSLLTGPFTYNVTLCTIVLNSGFLFLGSHNCMAVHYNCFIGPVGLNTGGFGLTTVPDPSPLGKERESMHS